MNFTSPLYLYFLVILFIVYKIFRQFKQPSFGILWILLPASYFFYGVYSPKYLLLIAIPTIVDFHLGKKIFQAKNQKKFFFLVLSLCLNIGILGFFKYANFGIEILNSILFRKNLLENGLFISVILPAGISFYTFQSMSYTIDVYRGKICPEKSIFRYALYLAFFPQLVAGPIVVARDLLPQIETLGFQKQTSYSKVIYLLLLGFTKKAVIADKIAPTIDILYAHPTFFTAGDWIIGLFAYSLQIYCDFSGYTDIARGSALAFGIYLPENFNLPYLSSSFSEFWRRWHITLSGWLREYLYISLGGNRVSVVRTMINLLLTMLLGGLWHGASWNFVIWGGCHGVLLSLERYFQKYHFSGFPEGSTGSFWQKMGFLTLFSLRRIIVFLCITGLWVFFRSKDLSVSQEVFSVIFSGGDGFHLGYKERNFVFANFFVVGVSHWIGYKYGDRISAGLEKEISWILGTLFALWLFLAVSLSRESRPFLYFVF